MWNLGLIHRYFWFSSLSLSGCLATYLIPMHFNTLHEYIEKLPLSTHLGKKQPHCADNLNFTSLVANRAWAEQYCYYQYTLADSQ